MLYLVIEHFIPGKQAEIYRRFEEKGRMLPYQVNYINSWINCDLDTCYQLMESDTLENLQDWMKNWNDLAHFEIIPVLTSAEAKKRILDK